VGFLPPCSNRSSGAYGVNFRLRVSDNDRVHCIPGAGSCLRFAPVLGPFSCPVQILWLSPWPRKQQKERELCISLLTVDYYVPKENGTFQRPPWGFLLCITAWESQEKDSYKTFSKNPGNKPRIRKLCASQQALSRKHSANSFSW
jgi:hypothetical protein